MIKWAEIAGKSSKARFETLSEFLQQNGIENQVDFIECEPDQFKETLAEAVKEYKILRVGSPYGKAVVGQFKNQSAETMILQAADCITFVDRNWELASTNHIGLQRIIYDVGNKIDLESSVLVVGAGAGARVACSAFIRVGFKKINITNKFVEEAEQLIRELKRIYFGIEFEFIPPENLVKLLGENSVLVNTTPLMESNDILPELYYFNFLKNPGIVFDFTFVPINTPLIVEADKINIPSVRGYEISSWGDMAWVEWTFKKKLSREKYCDLLKARTEEMEKEVIGESSES